MELLEALLWYGRTAAALWSSTPWSGYPGCTQHWPQPHGRTRRLMADGINHVSSWELILRWRKQPADEQVKVSKDKEHVLQGEGALYLLDAPSTAQLGTNFILIWSNFKTPSGPALFSSGHAEDFTKAKEKLVFQKWTEHPNSFAMFSFHFWSTSCAVH